MRREEAVELLSADKDGREQYFRPGLNSQRTPPGKLLFSQAGMGQVREKAWKPCGEQMMKN